MGRDREKYRAWVARRRAEDPNWATEVGLRNTLQHNYGLSIYEYRGMVRRQEGKCAACKHPPPEGKRLHVDHDHGSTKVRALLCNACNSALGFLREDPARIQNLLTYALRCRGQETAPPPPPVLWTSADVALAFGVTRQTVHSMVRKGELAVAAWTPRRQQLFNPVVVERLAEARKTKGRHCGEGTATV